MFSKIVEAGCVQLALPEDLVNKLVTFIDVLKIKGLVGGTAASKFGDFLGFLGIPDNEVTQQFFGDRWSDHRVHIEVPTELNRYLNSDTPLFTPSRLEPQYQDKPFYEQGITKVAPGTYGNPEDVCSVRKAPPLTESYSNFIVTANVPDQFYMEVANTRLDNILSNGLAKTDESDPYKIYSSVEEARASLFKDIQTQNGHQHKTAKAIDYTLISISSDFLEMNNDVFYTRKLSGHRQGSRSYGYFYTGHVKARGLSVSTLNKVTM